MKILVKSSGKRSSGREPVLTLVPEIILVRRVRAGNEIKCWKIRGTPIQGRKNAECQTFQLIFDIWGPTLPFPVPDESTWSELLPGCTLVVRSC